MPGPVARLRLVAGAAALVTIAAAGVVLASGTSATAGGTAISTSAAATAPFVGPVAAPPPPRPLIRTDGPLLLTLPGRPARLTAAPRTPMGPAVVAAPAPAVDEVGPDSGVVQVRQVQRLLNSRGAGLRVDGAWGPATTAAVRRLQAELGLPVDGRAGRETLRALHR